MLKMICSAIGAMLVLTSAVVASDKNIESLKSKAMHNSTSANKLSVNAEKAGISARNKEAEFQRHSEAAERSAKNLELEDRKRHAEKAKSALNNSIKLHERTAEIAEEAKHAHSNAKVNYQDVLSAREAKKGRPYNRLEKMKSTSHSMITSHEQARSRMDNLATDAAKSRDRLKVLEDKIKKADKKGTRIFTSEEGLSETK
ncbi:MAG: hypothetical protein ABIQ95_00015 [Bdellovibrionia bacterium]